MSSETTRTLLQAVLEEPEDINNRRVYGDALGVDGDPRGELIQVQCDLAECTAHDPRWAELLKRERALLAKHEKAWTAPFKSFLYNPRFERGMIEHAFVDGKKISAVGALLEREPVMSLGMRGLTQANAAVLGQRAELARLKALRVSESKLGLRGAEALFTPRLEKLRILDLYQAGLDDDALAHLARTVFPRLERLDLSGNRLTMTAVQDLLGDRRLARLTSLAMKWLAPGSDGASQITEHLDLPALARLDLGSSRYSDRDLRQLAGNPTFAKLKELRLEHNEISGAEAIEALAPLTELEVLDLSTNSIGVEGITALVKSSFPLRTLRLYQCAVGGLEATVLARAAFPKLTALDLGYGSLGPVGMAALARTSWPLEKLELWANKILDEGVCTLAGSPWTRTLRELVIGYIGITDAGVAALAAGTWPALERIVFRGDSIGESGARALAESTTMPALRYIKLEGTGTPKRPLAALHKRGVELELRS